MEKPAEKKGNAGSNLLWPSIGPRPHAGIDRVALCLDRSELGERALPHAVLVARALGTPLALLHVLNSREGQVAWDAYEWEILRSESRAYLDRVRSLAAESVEQIEVRLVEGEVEDQLLHEIGIGCTQIVVLATHGEHGLHGWHMGRTARQVLVAAPCSLLLVPAWLEPLDEKRGYQRILVPLDGSPRAECAMPIAVHLARTCGAELILLHVVPGAQLTRAETARPEEQKLVRELDERNARVGRRYLERVQRRYADEIAVRMLLPSGQDVRDVLLEFSEQERIDLIVMSAHGQTGSDSRPYGSTATHLVEHGVRPLLLVQDLSAEARKRLARAFRERRQPVRRASLFHNAIR